MSRFGKMIGVAVDTVKSGDFVKIKLSGKATLSSVISYGEDKVKTYKMKTIRRAPQVDFTFEKLPERVADTHGQFLHNAHLIKVYLIMCKSYPETVLPTIEHEAIHSGLDDMDFFEEQEEDMIDAVLQARWEGDLM